MRGKQIELKFGHFYNLCQGVPIRFIGETYLVKKFCQRTFDPGKS